MAEINASQNGQSKRAGTPKRARLSTRIDLTPMVDLGFLLITFFLFTTTLARPKVMTVNLPFIPPDKMIETQWSDAQTMTIILSGNHQLYYYNGIVNNPEIKSLVSVTGFGASKGIRDAIIEKKKQVRALQDLGILKKGRDAAFLIKPDTNSTYEDFVQIMDEMNINDVKMKAVVKITSTDQQLITGVKVP